MSRIAPFRPDRFTSASGHYVNARPRYAPALLDRLAHQTGLHRGSRVLDLGCGPGTLAIPLARYAATVIGIDPSQEMIASARRQSADLGATVDWRVGSSQDLDPSLAPLDLVVMGRSFHWMDRDATLARLDGLVAPQGALALLATESLPFPEGRWQDVFDAVRAEFGRPDAFDAFRRSPQWEPHDAVLLRSPFSRLERFGIVEKRASSIDGLISRALSQSSTTPEALGDKLAAFEKALRDALLAACPDGRFPEIMESVALLARRPVAP
jgi:SAM-dependent methyltransferase